MEVTFIPKDATLGTLKVVIAPEDYLPNVDKEAKKLASKAQIKGFRTGKTPISVIKNLYGNQIIAEETNQIFSKAINDYLSTNEIDYLGEPMPSETYQDEYNFDWRNPSAFTFHIDIATPSPFELSYENTTATNYSIIFDDEALQETISNIQKNFSTRVEVENSEADDVVSGSSTWTNEEGSVETFKTFIPTDKLKKDAQNQFVGLKVGDTLDFVPETLFEDNKEIRYMLGVFDEAKIAIIAAQKLTLTIEKIERSIPSELNEEFFSKVFPNEAIANEEQFKQRVKDINVESLQLEANKFIFEVLKDKLVAAHQFDLPKDFLKKWLAYSNQGKVSMEEIEKEYPKFEEDLRWVVLQRKIAKQENISVGKEDVENRAIDLLASQMKQYGIYTEENVASLPQLARKMLAENKGKQYRDIENMIFGEKIQEVLFQKVPMQVENVTWKGLVEISENYYKNKYKDTPIEMETI